MLNASASFFYWTLLLGFATGLLAQGNPKPPTAANKAAEPPAAQAAPRVVYAPYDSLFLTIEDNKKYLWHRFKQGETPYGLAKFFGLHTQDIYGANPKLLNRSPQLNEWIRIPLAAKAIRREPPQAQEENEFIPLYYIVKEGETLYRIAKVHFKMPVEVLVKRNKLKNDQVRLGQALHIAWLPKMGLNDSLQLGLAGLVGPIAEENAKWKKIYEEKLANKTEVQSEGVAVWPKGERIRDQTSLYALSSELKSGTIIRIENPMFRRSVYAEISGPLPDISETEGASLMLSPALARALGGLDQRFFVRWRYKK